MEEATVGRDCRHSGVAVRSRNAAATPPHGSQAAPASPACRRNRKPQRLSTAAQPKPAAQPRLGSADTPSRQKPTARQQASTRAASRLARRRAMPAAPSTAHVMPACPARCRGGDVDASVPVAARGSRLKEDVLRHGEQSAGPCVRRALGRVASAGTVPRRRREFLSPASRSATRASAIVPMSPAPPDASRASGAGAAERGAARPPSTRST